MPQQDVENIVRSLSQILPAQLEQRRLNEEKLYRQQQLDLENRRFEAQNTANQKLFELQKSQVEAQQAQTELANVGAFQRTGINPPGYVVQPGVQPTPQQPLVLSGLQNATLIPPSGRVYSVPPLAETPEQQLVRQQAQQAEAAKVRESQATQQAETARMLQVGEQQGRRIIEAARLEHGYRMDEQDKRLAGEKELEGMKATSALAVAKIRGGDLGDLADMPGAADTLFRIRTGTMSQEEVNRSPYKKQLARLAMQNDAQILPKATTDKIIGIENMTNLLPKIREMLNLRFTHPVEVNNPFTDVGQQYSRLSDAVRAASGQASVALTGVRRFSQRELERFDNYFIPSKGILTSNPQANLKVYNSFVNDLATATGQVTKGLSKSQTSDILSNLKGAGATYLQNLPQQNQIQYPTQKVGVGIKIYKQNPKTGMLELQQ